METNRCPICGQPIAIDDINVKEGVGLCRSCGKLSRLADIEVAPAPDPEALQTPPPPGCSYEEPMGGGAVVRASLRSRNSALTLLVMCLFWNGIVSIFVLIAVGGLYTHFGGHLPTWFPIPGGSGKNERSVVNMPLGVLVFLSLFLIPFVVIGLAMFVAFVTSLIGRIEVIVMGNDARVRTGFGPFNWTSRFDASRVKRVTIGQTTNQQNAQRKALIQIEADRTVKFGATLPDERRAWMLSVLRLLLVAPSSGGGGATPGLRPLAGR